MTKLLIVPIILAAGCVTQVTTTKTAFREETSFLGIDISASPANGTPHLRFGSGRQVLTMTPTSPTDLHTIQSGGTYSAVTGWNPLGVNLDTSDFTGPYVYTYDGTNVLSKTYGNHLLGYDTNAAPWYIAAPSAVGTATNAAPGLTQTPNSTTHP